jgi:hypothetical protein
LGGFEFPVHGSAPHRQSATRTQIPKAPRRAAINGKVTVDSAPHPQLQELQLILTLIIKIKKATDSPPDQGTRAGDGGPLDRK